MAAVAGSGVMARRVGLPRQFACVAPGCFFDPSWPVPERFYGRGRWQGGPLHTFVDDYRQEFFFRRPEEGLLVACAARIVTAPDFTVYNDDPPLWREYQAWRSQVVAGYWQAAGVRVLPVVSFGSCVQRFVAPGSTWAVRGPGRSHLDEWLERMCEFLEVSRAARLVVFGRVPLALSGFDVEIVQRRLVPSTEEG